MLLSFFFFTLYGCVAHFRQLNGGCPLWSYWHVWYGTIKDLWLNRDLRRFALELSYASTCHHALQVLIHWVLILFSNLQTLAVLNQNYSHCLVAVHLKSTNQVTM